MNPAMAGLGALTKQTSQPTGRSPESMSQTMALAKQMSDMQLADVLAGKSMNIPQYVAMTEAMGRKQLRTAMQGMTAMTSVKQPTEREKLLSEMMPRQPQQTIMSVPSQGGQPAAGIDTLPADNMQGLADGGIIAFAGDGAQGQQVKEDSNVDIMDRLRQDDPNAFQRMMRRMFPSLVNDARTGSFSGTTDSTVFTPSVKDVPFVTGEIPETGAALPYRRQRGASNAVAPDLSTRNTDLIPKQDLSLLKPSPESLSVEGVDPTDASEFLNTLKTVPQGVAPPKPDAAPKAGGTNTGGGPGGGGPGGGGPGGYGGGSLAGTDLSRFAEKQADLLRPKERNKDYYEALTKPTEDIAKQVASGKEQAQGEFLMNLGASLMSTPNIGIALSKGVQAGLPGLAASRKEINALTKDQRDYQFNIAKAKEARDQGDEMLALNYLKLAEESKYHAGMVGAYMARAGNAAAFGPKQYQAAMTNAQKEVDNRIGKMGPLDKRKLTPETRQQMIEDAFTRNLEAYRTGSIPATQDPSLELFDNPGGPILKRP